MSDLPFRLQTKLHLQMVALLHTSRREMTPARKQVSGNIYVRDAAATGNKKHANVRTMFSDGAELSVARLPASRVDLTQRNARCNLFLFFQLRGQAE